jgi:hypothetical protein
MSAALPARRGHADVYASKSTVKAHGTTRPRVVSETKPALSPARQQLADHIANLAKLRAAADKAAKPADRLREQLSAAMLDLQNS